MQDFYREELLEIVKNPQHKGHIKNADATISENNPYCGDEIKLDLKIKDGIVEEARFRGSACAVSVISAERLLDFIEGKSVKKAKELTQEELLQILGIQVSMSRLRCATLVMTALKKALDKTKI